MAGGWGIGEGGEEVWLEGGGGGVAGGWERRCGWRVGNRRGWRVGNRGCDVRVGEEVWLESGRRRCGWRVGNRGVMGG